MKQSNVLVWVAALVFFVVLGMAMWLPGPAPVEARPLQHGCFHEAFPGVWIPDGVGFHDAGCGQHTPTPDPNATATPTPTPTATPTYTPTATRRPTRRPTATSTPTPTPADTATPTATAAMVPAGPPTFTPTPTATMVSTIPPTYAPPATARPTKPAASKRPGPTSPPATRHTRCVIRHAATPVNLCPVPTGGWQLYYIGSNGRISTGPHIPAPHNYDGQAMPVLLASETHPYNGHAITVSYLPSRDIVEIRTHYSNPPKLYLLHIHPNNTVKYLHW